MVSRIITINRLQSDYFGVEYDACSKIYGVNSMAWTDVSEAQFAQQSQRDDAAERASGVAAGAVSETTFGVEINRSHGRRDRCNSQMTDRQIGSDVGRAAS